MRQQVQGADTREHLKIAAKGTTQGAQKAREMLAKDRLQCPIEYTALWRAFGEMDRWRGAGATGPAPLTLHDVEAWERRTGVTLSMHEAEVLKLLDSIRLAALYAKAT